MFQQMDNNWDILCNLDLPNETCQVISADEKRAEDAIAKGKSVPSKRSNNPQPPSHPSTGEIDDSSDILETGDGLLTAHESFDNNFFTRIVAGMGVNKFGEFWLLTQFRDYVKTILDQAIDSKYRSTDREAQGTCNDKFSITRRNKAFIYLMFA